MSKFCLLFFLVFSGFRLFGQFDITFQVDMSSNIEFDENIHQVYLSGARHNASAGFGNLPAWPVPGSNTAFLMSPLGNGIYSITMNNVQAGQYAYKFFLVYNNQITWSMGEWSEPINRIVSVSATNVQTNDVWAMFDNQNVLLKINEVLASNGTTSSDEDGDFEDWIEIYNAGTEPTNLNGFGLSDVQSFPFRWTFPSFFILPNEYIVVWASGKNKKNINQPLHTNFNLSSSGEDIRLTDNSGNVLDEIPAVQHQTDVAYGRFPNASGTIAYLTSPSPEASNEGPSFNGLSAPLQFSVPDGYYNANVTVSITSADQSAVIRYTLDGSEPNENSSIYTSPLTFQNLAGTPNMHSNIPTNELSPGSPYFEGWQAPLSEVYKINVLRAKAFNNAFPPANSYNKTYIIEPLLHKRYSLAVMSLTSDFAYLFDDETGMYVYGNSGNYWEDWERPGNFTYFQKNGELGFNENAGYQLNGNTTRSRPRKAIRMVFKTQYGDSWLNYPIFESKNVDQYKRLILRNGGNDWGNSLIRDGIGQILARDLNIETQHFQPTILFINGEYWGIHDLRDRYGTHYFEAKYGIFAQELTILENDASFKDGNPEGLAHYEELISFIENHNLSQNSAYQTVLTKIDIASFIDFQLANIFPKNTDWPGNNVLYWRYLRPEFNPTAGKLDGRWRWMLYDQDFAFDLNFTYVPFLNQGAAHNTLSFALENDGPSWPNPNWSTFLLRKLVENDTFKIQFVNRYCDLLNTVYHPDFTTSTIDSIRNMLFPEMQEHIDRWRAPASVNDWLNEISDMKTFAEERADYQFQHLQQVFGLGPKYALLVDVNDDSQGFVKLNSLDLKSETLGVQAPVYPWQGAYLQGIPIRLSAIPKPGFVFSNWSGNASGTNAQIVLNPNMAYNVKAHFEPLNENNYELLHFWFFGSNLANDTPLDSIAPTFSTNHATLNYLSCMTGYPFDSNHPNWRQASMERRNAPTELNYSQEGNNNIAYASANMRAIQIKQPFKVDDQENAIELKFSTLGYENITLNFAAKDEGAADGLIIEYKNPEEMDNFSTSDIVSQHSLMENYTLYQVFFAPVSLSKDADTFVIRIRFSGDNLHINQGGRVAFNNISVKGTLIPEIEPHPNAFEFNLYPNPSQNKVFVAVEDTLQEVIFYSTSGQEAARFDTSGNAYLDISELAQGVYLVKAIYANGSMNTLKFVKFH